MAESLITMFPSLHLGAITACERKNFTGIKGRYRINLTGVTI